jgi:hypothetical protein
MKEIAISFFLFLSLIVKAQPPDSLIIFSGYILDEDSLPIENAHLISFRTMKSYSTDQKGFFRIRLSIGDSLLINHISYDRKIVKANNKPPKLNSFYLKFSPYEMNSISINSRDIEMNNLEQNMKSISIQMEEKTPSYNFNSGRNIYAPPSASDHYAGINIFELMSYIKNRKYIKRVKENNRGRGK